MLTSIEATQGREKADEFDMLENMGTENTGTDGTFHWFLKQLVREVHTPM